MSKGGQERRTGTISKWAGSERPDVIEGEMQEYKFPASICQRHFPSQPVSSHSTFIFLLSFVLQQLQNELQKDHHGVHPFYPHLLDPFYTPVWELCQHLWWCWWTGGQNFIQLHIPASIWCPNDLFVLVLQAEQRAGWWCRWIQGGWRWNHG